MVPVFVTTYVCVIGAVFSIVVFSFLQLVMSLVRYKPQTGNTWRPLR